MALPAREIVIVESCVRPTHAPGSNGIGEAVHTSKREIATVNRCPAADIARTELALARDVGSGRDTRPIRLRETRRAV